MNSSLSLNMLLIVPLAPLVMSILVGVFGTALGGNILGRKASQILAISGAFISFVVSVLVFKQTLAGATFNQTIYEWMNIGGLKMEVGFMVDNLTAMMMCAVTFVSLMVHIYTVGYMEDDDG